MYRYINVKKIYILFGGVAMENWESVIVKDFPIIESTETLSKVLPKLKTEKQGIVFDKGKYLGIVTRKNAIKDGINLPEEKVSNLVYKPPMIYLDTPDLDFARCFIESGAHFLPVFDSKEKNKVIGVVYRLDFLKQIVMPYLKGYKVSDFANTKIRTIGPNDTLAKALSSFQELGISKLIVFDKKLKGVVSLSNILTYFLHATQITKSNLQGALVRQVMKEDVITIDKSENISKLIPLFVDKNVSSVIVLDNGELYGIITKTDILEQFVYAMELDVKDSSIQISAKFTGLYRPDIEKKLQQLEKFGDTKNKVFAYYKMGKEKFRGLPLVNCRVRVVSPRKHFNVSVEGWGVEHATELAVQKLKRQMGDVRF